MDVLTFDSMKNHFIRKTIMSGYGLYYQVYFSMIYLYWYYENLFIHFGNTIGVIWYKANSNS